ncbi:redoxin domain-containing protein [Candidatus Poribacteria bacterium]|nr:redoxin domain-containing protein [Candidatus Poribacteria bacterium]
MRYLTAILLAIMLMFSLQSLADDEKKEENKLKVGDPAPNFILKDPLDKEYELKKILDKEEGTAKVVFLLIGTRKVQKMGDEWTFGLEEIYGKKEDIKVFLMGDLRGLPFFVTKGMVKWGAKGENERLPATILLDWKGKVSKKYDTEKDKPNLIIIDSDMKIAYKKVVDNFTKEAVKEVVEVVEKALKKADAEDSEAKENIEQKE